MSSHNYLPHIDGLRAIAVLSVFMFHLNFNIFSGGFVGVDVFFVISGYLITGGIYKELLAGRFSLQAFYQRRIKRILPAYFTMVIVVLILSALLYPFMQLKTVAGTAAMSSVFLANIRFAVKESNYFAADVHEDPLLNLWSLGVEEQFYLVIPLLFLLLWRFMPSWFKPAMWLMFILSIVSCLLVMYFGQPKSAFYFPHLRAWEFLAGSILAVAGTAAAKQNLKANVLSVLGLLLVAVPVFTYTQETLFPGVAALPVVLGTVLVLHYGVNGGVAGQILKSAPFIFIGRISYSLYLWHWPVIVFWRYVRFNEILPIDNIGIILASFMLAILSWHFVEMEFRFRVASASYTYYLYTLAGSVIVGAFATFIVFTNGAKNYFNKEANSMIRDSGTLSRFADTQLWVVNNDTEFTYAQLTGLDKNLLIPIGDQTAEKSFLIWGDSHAVSLLPGIDSLARVNNKGGYLLNRQTGISNDRIKYYKHVTQWLQEQQNIEQVFLIQRWSVRLESESQRQFMVNFCNNLKNLGLKTTIFQNVPEFSVDPIVFQARVKILNSFGDFRNSPMVDTTTYKKLTQPYGKLFKKLAKDAAFKILPTDHVFLKNGMYHAMNNEGELLYYDTHHLSPEGSRLLIKSLSDKVF
ncbi:acyltransferase family protein [Pedobacter sp.]|uniref:acyltransferase family protein n=1 Tax=Pedobacter sp. TaxID=1411316 RepID=UPI003D7FD6CC